MFKPRPFLRRVAIIHPTTLETPPTSQVEHREFKKQDASTRPIAYIGASVVPLRHATITKGAGAAQGASE